MRILLFSNNWVGWQTAKWLREQGEEIAGLALHPEERRRYGVETIRDSGVPPDRIFNGAALKDPETAATLSSLNAEIGLSAYFGYLLNRVLIESLPGGCINIHPSFLPYNRGTYPNVWSIVDGTPAGATIHYIDEGVDTGDIISQREIDVEAFDTGQSLYDKLEGLAFTLFKESWPDIRTGRSSRVPQRVGVGTLHRKKDVDRIDRIDLDSMVRAGDLINILRARTFPPYAGAYFMDGTKKVHMSLQLASGEDQNPTADSPPKTVTIAPSGDGS